MSELETICAIYHQRKAAYTYEAQLRLRDSEPEFAVLFQQLAAEQAYDARRILSREL